ncbi:NDP-hexose 2,3-dehydratase family protein [Amycolatopsis sp. cg5]|uniref:NDP-hexose 2,3-dehydratase family protein n=1 Tax=Amycolatopsis sp. cg5 TaxID=3238802 RepID=UPI003523FF67
MASAQPEVLLHGADRAQGARFTRSASVTENPLLPTARFHEWFAGRAGAGSLSVARIPFDDLRGWSFDERTGNLGHVSGRFFTVEGLEVETDYGVVPQWTQPIINQPEIGILGILVKQIGGVLHCLMQAKMEPGNEPLMQLSPTVQATRSNYTRVHQGGSIPYLEHFAGAKRGRVLVDVLQSEQGAWFYQKRNRNIVVETTEDFPLHPDFCWLTIGQVQELLLHDNLVNMDARTVLSCIPFVSEDSGALHSMGEILSWITDTKTRYDLSVRRIPLRAVKNWEKTADAIRHEDGKHFEAVAVAVTGNTREVASWTQPLFAPRGQGVVAFLTKRAEGVRHILVHARCEPGYLDTVELAPTVQCTPSNYEGLPEAATPPFLDEVLSARPERILYDTVQSEEGGRFYRALTRYQIIETGPDFPRDLPADYRWLTVGQLTELVQHSRYLNVQARTLVACLHGLAT